MDQHSRPSRSKIADSSYPGDCYSRKQTSSTQRVLVVASVTSLSLYAENGTLLFLVVADVTFVFLVAAIITFPFLVAGIVSFLLQSENAFSCQT